MFVYEMFDHSLMFVEFQPKQVEDTNKIIKHIYDELESIIGHGFTDRELSRATKKSELSYLSVFENTQELAGAIGRRLGSHSRDMVILRLKSNL